MNENSFFFNFDFFLLQEVHEDDWYNKSLTALRMNNSHPGLGNPMLQYQV